MVTGILFLLLFSAAIVDLFVVNDFRGSACQLFLKSCTISDLKHKI